VHTGPSAPPIAVTTPSGQMYMLDAATYHANMALTLNQKSVNHVSATPGMRTVSFATGLSRVNTPS
jgi:hypothetical protein